MKRRTFLSLIGMLPLLRRMPTPVEPASFALPVQPIVPDFKSTKTYKVDVADWLLWDEETKRWAPLYEFYEGPNDGISRHGAGDDPGPKADVGTG